MLNVNEEKVNKLKEARIKRGLSRQQLANLSGISVRTIESWEQGLREFKNASLADALKIADVLFVDVKSLV